MDEVRDRVVLITGAGQGIGRTTARLLADHGACVVLGSRTGTALETLADEIRTAGGRAVHRTADVASPADVRALVELALEQYGQLDAAVANAGIALNGPLEAAATDHWDRMIDVNLRGVLHTMAAAVPVFRHQGSGHFITVGSTSATKWVPGQGVYAATKAAARAATDILRQELAPHGIRTTFISPGFTDTTFVASTPDPRERAALEARRDAIAMPPDAVASAILYALTRPTDIDIGEITVRPTVQS